MAKETNETSLRGTNAMPQSRKGSWRKRLLKTTFRVVWVIEKVLTFIAWLTGSSLS